MDSGILFEKIKNNLTTQQIIRYTHLIMRYSLEPKYRKNVQGYGFLSFAKKFGDKYGKKLMDTATKNRNKCCKNCF